MKIDNNRCNICSFDEFELIKDKLRDDRVEYKVKNFYGEQFESEGKSDAFIAIAIKKDGSCE